MEADSSSWGSESSESSASSPEIPDPGITVRFSVTVPEKHPPIYAYALKAEVTSATGRPDHIFVFQRSKENAQGDSVDEFIQIASPLECEEVPENAPRLDEGMPYYRAKEVTLWFRCLEDLQLAKNKMSGDIRTLASTFDILDGEYDAQEEIRYE